MSGTGEPLTHVLLSGISRLDLDDTLARLLQPIIANNSRPIVTLHVGNTLSSDPATVSRSTVQGRPQILVSDQQRPIMYTAYNVAYGGVEPLRVWEGDITLSHLLSALECTGEPISHPLGPGFVYRIQSILTKAGKSSLWKSFCDLEESGEWSNAEAHFLRARRRCLQPFVDRLREEIPDRVVIDLTDPFLRSLHLDTVLFSIFIDRLVQDQVNPVVVCSNAHRYFTAHMTDAFRDTLLSILRGRDLGTVLLATQDPTVIPPEITSAMDLVLCHRFSSPLWLQYIQANFGLGSTQDLHHRLTCLEPSSGIAIFANGRLVDYGGTIRQETTAKPYDKSAPPDNTRAVVDMSPPGTSSSVTLNVPDVTLASPPPNPSANPQTSNATTARRTYPNLPASPTVATDTPGPTPPNPAALFPGKIPIKRFRMLFIAIEAIYVSLNLKNKKVPMTALITRLTDEDLSRMQVSSATEAVERAQEAGLVKGEVSGGATFVSIASDEFKVMLDTKPVENALRQSENETLIHIDRLAKRENIANVVKNSGFATFHEYLRVAENRGLLRLNASKTMVGLPGANITSPSNTSTTKVNEIAKQFASMSSKDREALAKVLKG